MCVEITEPTDALPPKKFVKIAEFPAVVSTPNVELLDPFPANPKNRGRLICIDRLCPCGHRLLDGYIRSLQIAAGVTLLTSQMHEMTKNVKQTLIRKIATRFLPMARRLLDLWLEHADVPMTVEPFEDQVQRL